MIWVATAKCVFSCTIRLDTVVPTASVARAHRLTTAFAEGRAPSVARVFATALCYNQMKDGIAPSFVRRCTTLRAALLEVLHWREIFLAVRKRPCIKLVSSALLPFFALSIASRPNSR